MAREAASPTMRQPQWFAQRMRQAPSRRPHLRCRPSLPRIVHVRRLRSRLILLCLCFSLAVAGCAGSLAQSIHASTYGPRSFQAGGETGPVIVLEAGLGDGADTWRPIFSDLAAYARPFAYDRAGYGESRSSARPRDGETIVRELRSLLAEQNQSPPYVLVGHSLGGQFVELFARLHPEEIAAVVLIESRHVDYSARCEAAGVERCPMPAWLRLLLPRAARLEVDAAPRTEAQLKAAGPFPPVPLVVLSGARRPGSSAALKQLWAATQSELTQLSPDSRQEICEDCGHYVHRDDPGRVVRALRGLVGPLMQTGPGASDGEGRFEVERSRPSGGPVSWR